jgi:actin-like ATPase involved in cell morphogenesis
MRIWRRRPDLVIDLGTAYTRILDPGAGLVEAPSRDPLTGQPFVAQGVVIDEDAAARLLRDLIGRVRRRRVRVAASCPLDVAYAAARLARALKAAGASGVELIRSTAAAAAGAGVDVASGHAEMLVDVGAGLTEVAVFRDGCVLDSAILPFDAREAQATPRALAEHVFSIWKGLAVGPQVEVIENGLVLAGGGAESPELVRAVIAAARLEVRVAAEPGRAVIRGLARLALGLRGGPRASESWTTAA